MAVEVAIKVVDSAIRDTWYILQNSNKKRVSLK